MGESDLCYLFRCRIDRRSKMSSQASNSDVRLRNSNLTFCMTVKSSFSFERVNLSEFTKKVRVHDCKYRESLARLKKSKILITYQKNSFGELSSKKILLTFKYIVLEKMRKNENSGFYLINYAKIRVKMAYFIASVPRQDSKL